MSKHTCAIFIFCLTSLSVHANTWKSAKANKKAQLDLFWFSSTPFIYEKNDEMGGLEYDILSLFQDYLSTTHDVDLNYNWIEANGFNSIMDSIIHHPNNNAFGVSAFSITTDRLKRMGATAPYLPDVTVLVSSKGSSIVNSQLEIHQMLNEMKAITIKGTIYDFLLLELQKQLNLTLNIEYIDSRENILDIINKHSDCYGFIDLPIYLIWIQNGKELVRQNHFTKRGLGYGFIIPRSSDWHVPFDAFLKDPSYKVKVSNIISKYLGDDIWDFIHGLHDREQLSTSILTKEKEIQTGLIEDANLELNQDKIYMRVLVIGIVVILLFLFIILRVLNHSHKTAKLFEKQKEQIETQQKNIKRKNNQLIHRNSQLVSINEERNYLMGILAHDLRSPVSSIINLSEMLDDNLKGNTSRENEELLDHVNEAAELMNQMITKILDKDSLYGNKDMVLKEAVNPAEIMEELCRRFKQTAKKKEITFILDMSAKMESVETDHLLLFLILQNLLSNALKFAPFNSKVTFTAQTKDKQIVFSVEDQGPGFTEEDQLLLFEKFQKLSAKPTGGEVSTGLGLSIVKRYTNQLDGDVWLETTLGQGSTFFVSFPV